jgi:ribosome maturation factor RimP
MTLIEDIERIIKPLIQSFALTLYDVSLVYENNVHYLRVLIERDDGQRVNLDDIVKVTEHVSPLLDKANLIQHTYTLDVASSGAEHEVNPSQLEKYVDRFVRLELNLPFEGEPFIQGKLIGTDHHLVTIEYRVKTRFKKAVVERINIKKANLAIHQ